MRENNVIVKVEDCVVDFSLPGTIRALQGDPSQVPGDFSEMTTYCSNSVCELNLWHSKSLRAVL